MDLEEDDELFARQDDLEKQVFDCSVTIKKSLLSTSCLPETSPEGEV